MILRWRREGRTERERENGLQSPGMGRRNALLQFQPFKLVFHQDCKVIMLKKK